MLRQKSNILLLMYVQFLQTQKSYIHSGEFLISSRFFGALQAILLTVKHASTCVACCKELINNINKLNIFPYLKPGTCVLNNFLLYVIQLYTV